MRTLGLCSLAVFLMTAFGLGQEMNFGNGPQYLLTTGSPSFARPISTPQYVIDYPPLQVGASDATEGLITGAENRIVTTDQPDAPPPVDLFPIYYGTHSQTPSASVIEISFAQSGSANSSTEIPESILDTGKSQVTTAQALRARGYGITLAEAAQNSKANARRADRVYNNADIARMHIATNQLPPAMVKASMD